MGQIIIKPLGQVKIAAKQEESTRYAQQLLNPASTSDEKFVNYIVESNSKSYEPNGQDITTNHQEHSHVD